MFPKIANTFRLFLSSFPYRVTSLSHAQKQPTEDCGNRVPTKQDRNTKNHEQCDLNRRAYDFHFRTDVLRNI